VIEMLGTLCAAEKNAEKHAAIGGAPLELAAAVTGRQDVASFDRRHDKAKTF
jgi:hypothetical protein